MGVTPTLIPFVGAWEDATSTRLDVPSKGIGHLLYDLCSTEESSLRGEYAVRTVWSEEYGVFHPVLTREQVLSIPVGQGWEWEGVAAWAYVAELPEGAFVAIDLS